MSYSSTNAAGQWTPPQAPAEIKRAFGEDAPGGLSATAPEFRPAGKGRRKTRKTRKTRKSRKTRSRRHRKGGASCSGM